MLAMSDKVNTIECHRYTKFKTMLPIAKEPFNFSKICNPFNMKIPQNSYNTFCMHVEFINHNTSL